MAFATGDVNEAGFSKKEGSPDSAGAALSDRECRAQYCDDIPGSGRVESEDAANPAP